MQIRITGFIALFISMIVSITASQAAQSLTKVIMTTGSFSEREAAMYVAQDYGMFKRYGLDLTFVHVRSGPVGMAAIASGETQLHSGSATAAVLGAAAEGIDLVFVAGIINKLIGNIMASPKIKTPADLKGKVIAVTSASGGSWMFTTLALEYWGLDAKRDGITFRILGDESVRSQALLNETVAATHLGYTFSAPLVSRGFTNLADLAKLPIPIPEHWGFNYQALYEFFARRCGSRDPWTRRFVSVYRPAGKQTGGPQEPHERSKIAES